MYCPNCGSANAEGATVCANCGQQLAPTAAPTPPVPPAPPAPPAAPAGYAAPPAPPVGYQPEPGYAQPQPVYTSPAPAGPPIKSHLVMAILATFFCCLPFGVVGIVFASQVNSKLAAGDYAGAQKASKSAALWSWIAIGLGLVGGILYAAVLALSVVTSSSSF